LARPYTPVPLVLAVVPNTPKLAPVVEEA